MNNFIKTVIEEKFASKAQQKYFYAKAGDETLSKKERQKWSKMAKEYSKKSNFKKLPEKADVEEIVDDNGNIKRGSTPQGLKRSITTSKSTTDKVVKTGSGAMGTHGVHGTHTSLRYWAEADMSKSLGYDETLGDDESYKQAYEYFTKELGMEREEALERLKAMGYIPGEEEIVRLVENPKKFVEDYIESVLVGKSKNSEIIAKEDNEDLNPLILKQVNSLKKSIEKNKIPFDKILKHLKSE